MCGYFYNNGFIDFMFKDKSLLDYTNFFFPNMYKKNDKKKKKKKKNLNTKILKIKRYLLRYLCLA